MSHVEFHELNPMLLSAVSPRRVRVAQESAGESAGESCGDHKTTTDDILYIVTLSM